MIKLGPRNEQRHSSLTDEEREFYAFQIDFCFSILSKRPNQIEALQSAANALTAMGYFADGLALDRKLVSLLPDDSMVQYNLACSLALTDHIEEAIRTLRLAINMGYGDISHMSRDPDLAPIRDTSGFRELISEARSSSRMVRGE